MKTLHISELKPDSKNINKHTERGSKMLQTSLQKFGAGRSILIDKDNQIIAGNLTAEEAGQIGLENVQIVESDGTKLIAVKRTDISLDSPEGRGLALADNRTADFFTPDIEIIQELQSEELLELNEWYSEVELAYLTPQININEELDANEVSDIPVSDTKQILLLFSGERYKMFIDNVAKLRLHYGAENSTDTIFYALNDMIKTL